MQLFIPPKPLLLTTVFIAIGAVQQSFLTSVNVGVLETQQVALYYSVYISPVFNTLEPLKAYQISGFPGPQQYIDQTRYLCGNMYPTIIAKFKNLLSVQSNARYHYLYSLEA